MLLALYNIVKKELRQTLRDRPMLGALLIAPMVQLVAFGYAVNLDVDKIPTVVFDEDKTQVSRDISRRLLAGGIFRGIGEVSSANEAEGTLFSGDAAVAIVVPRGYALRAARRDAPQVQVIVDGTDPTRAQVAMNAANQLIRMHQVQVEPGAATLGASSPMLHPRILFNPSMSSAVFMLPGLLAMLLIAVTAIVTAMGIAREREDGTLEQILVTPIRPIVLLTGKCIPFIFIGFIDITAVLLIGSWLFDMPMRGSLVVVAVASFLYLFSTLGVGIVLATVSSTQQQAMLGAVAFMAPAVLLSGFFSPIETMPAWLQPLTLLNPLRHYVEMGRACLLKGAGFLDLVIPIARLSALGVGLLTFAVLRFRRRVA